MIVGVCSPPYTQAFHRLVAQWSHIVVRWEYWSREWVSLSKEASGAWASQTAPVWVLTHNPPVREEALEARALGVTGWIWTDLDYPVEDLPDTLAYRLRVNASAVGAEGLLEIGAALEDTPYRLDLWGTGQVEVPEGLPFGEDFPQAVADHLTEGEPYRCTRGLRVVHFSGDIVRGCPFRGELPGTRATNVNAALEVLLAEAQSCTTGCYTAQAALADYLLADKAVWTPSAVRGCSSAPRRL